MSKRGWIISGIIVLISAIGFAVATYFISTNRQETPLVSSETKPSSLAPLAVPTESSTSEQIYEDSAGFSFKYPGELAVSDQTPDDNTHYSLLYLKNKAGETTRIRVKDVAYPTSDQWSTTEKEVPAGSKPVKSLTLSGLKADYYQTPAKLITMAISQNILYEIISPNTPYWQKTHSPLASSFVVGVGSSGEARSGSAGRSAGQSSSPADNTTYEAEEVVE